MKTLKWFIEGRKMKILIITTIIIAGFMTTASADYVSKSELGDSCSKFTTDDTAVYFNADISGQGNNDVIAWFGPDGSITSGGVYTYHRYFSSNGLNFWYYAVSTKRDIKDLKVGKWSVRFNSRPLVNFTILNISDMVDISYVNDDFADDPVNHKWNTIQKGFDYVKPGGTVIVYDGTYLENVEIGERVTLKGIGMPVIDSQGSGSPITISTDGATIDGFFIMGSTYPNDGIDVDSNNNVIVNNTVTNNFKGIYITGTNNTIDTNNISFNRIDELSDGIYITSSNNTVINNSIEGNRDEGIQIYSDNNNIIGNTIVSNGNSNDNTGIFISGSNNHLYHNNLIGNSINANDSSSNFWNSSIEGNYWSDYTGSDINGDGIGDTPHNIQGGTGKDNYPFMKQNGWISETITPVPTPTPNNLYPVIDGILSVGEWSNKRTITLNGFDNPSNTKNADLYIMNDNNSLYVAVVLPDNKQDSDYIMLDFDNGNDHIATSGGEDAAGLNVASLYGGKFGYLDYYWDGNWWKEDPVQHGSGAVTYSNGAYTYEFSKPLNSGDSHDVALSPGDSVGFRIETWDGTINDYYRYPVGTVDADKSVWNKWEDLLIVNQPTPTPTASGTTISISNTTTTPNSNITRSIMVENVNNLAAASILLTFDPNIVNVLSVSAGDMGSVIAGIDNTTGKVTMSAFSTSAKSGSVAFANVQLRAVGSINSTSPLTLTVPSLNDQNGAAIPYTIKNGTFTISSVIKGDVNGDGQVTIVDALFVAQYTVGMKTLSASQLAAADVNGDGQVTIVDALFIAQYTVGLRQL